jgi:hypothetical protein
MVKKAQPDVSIGKFDILATYAYARALQDGLSEGEAKERGIVAAVMGAKAKLGHKAGSHEGDSEAEDEAADKKKATLTARTFDRRVADKMGDFFEKEFLPAVKQFVAAHWSYEDVKRLLKVPTTWGAKISGEQFTERSKEGLKKRKTR